MIFGIPQRTIYSPSNVEYLQLLFKKKAASLIRLMKAASRGYSLSLGSISSSEELSLEQLIHYSVLSSTDWPLALKLAHNTLIRDLETLRRRITSHPIHFMPTEIVMDILINVLMFSNIETKCDLIQASRVWETLILTNGSLWSTLGYDSAPCDLLHLLMGDAPIRLDTLSDEVREYLPKLMNHSIRDLRIPFPKALYQDEASGQLVAKVEGEYEEKPDVLVLPITIQSLDLYINCDLVELCLSSWARFEHLNTLIINDLDTQLYGGLGISSFALPALKMLMLNLATPFQFLEGLNAPLLSYLQVSLPYEQDDSPFKMALHFALSFRQLTELGLRIGRKAISQNHVLIRDRGHISDCFYIISFRTLDNAVKDLTPPIPAILYPANLKPFDLDGLQYTWAKGITKLILCIADDGLVDLPTLDFPYLSHLKLISVGLNSTLIFLHHLHAVNLSKLKLRRKGQFSYTQQVLEPMFLEAFPAMVLGSDWENLVLQGQWSQLLRLSVPAESLLLGDHRQCSFPCIRNLSLSWVDATMNQEKFNDIRAAILTLFNLQTLRSLHLETPFGMPLPVHVMQLPAIEEIELGGRNTEKVLEQLYRFPLACPKLKTIQVQRNPRDWNQYCAILS